MQEYPNAWARRLPRAALGRFPWIVLAWATLNLAGCAADPEPRRQPARGLSGSPTPSDTRVVRAEDRLAFADGVPITLDQARPALLEAAGVRVVEEIALNRALALRLAVRGIEISESDLQRERELFLDAFLPEDGDALEGERVLAEVRARRGLGPERFGALLRRNAMLRALVRPEVAPTEASIEQAYALRWGPRYRVRIMLVPEAEDASAALARVRAGEDFSRVAAEVSADPSAARGGVVEPISPADPNVPAAVRRTVVGLAPGAVSDPIVLENGFALVKLDAVVDPETPEDPERARRAAERDARLAAERTLMAELLRETRAGLDIRPADPALRRVWDD